MRSNHPNDVIRDRARSAVHLAQIPGDKTMFDGRIVLRHDNLDLPLRTKKPTVYAVWNDLYHEDVPDDFRDRAYAVMALCPQHTFLVLTKRADRMAAYWLADKVQSRISWQTMELVKLYEKTWPLPNVFHGVTCENQQAADERIPDLLLVPGKRFLSLEPLLGPVKLIEYIFDPTGRFKTVDGKRKFEVRPTGAVDVVLLGGESGPNARPMNPQWARDVRDQCAAAGVPYFHKQNGEYASVSEVAGVGDHYCFPAGETVRRVGKKKAGRLLDGRTHDSLPWGGGQ